MSKSTRYVIEGTWSGYTSAQRKVCHRRVLTKRQADAQGKISSIGYSDGTSLYLSVRLAEPREKVQEIRGYDSLIQDCLRHGMTGYCSVDAIVAKDKAAKEAQSLLKET